MTDYPLLLTRQQASDFLGIDPKSFDKYIRNHPDFQCFMVGKHERYLKLNWFILLKIIVAVKIDNLRLFRYPI